MTKYKLTQDAYISDDGVTYEASAVDSNNNDVKLFWDIVYPEYVGACEDESDMCNWDKISGNQILGKSNEDAGFYDVDGDEFTIDEKGNVIRGDK